MRRHLPRAAVATGLVLAIAGLAACGTSGRALQDPPPGVTAPPRSVTSTTTRIPRVAQTSNTLSLTTDAWTPPGPLPRRYTCDGADVSPALAIANVPAGTVEVALVVTGPTGTNWVVAGLPPETDAFPEGAAPAGAIVATAPDGTARWVGPCPAPEAGTETYEFSLSALNAPSGVTPGMPVAEAAERVRSAGTAQVSLLTGTYAR